MTQLLLFPDPRPLVERLGREFFRQAPECPGVYLMHGDRDTVLYVGKAKNLRKRLNSYRVANPDRLRRRHLRLLRSVCRIELETCEDESAALARESELLRRLKPKFNRAGTWPARPRFLIWRCHQRRLELALAQDPQPGWALFGPLNSVGDFLLAVLIRLLWCASHPGLGPSQLPQGWIHGRFAEITRIQMGDLEPNPAGLVQRLLEYGRDAFMKVPEHLHRFDKAVLEADLEALTECLLAASRTKKPAVFFSDC